MELREPEDEQLYYAVLILFNIYEPLDLNKGKTGNTLNNAHNMSECNITWGLICNSKTRDLKINGPLIKFVGESLSGIPKLTDS